MTNGISVVVPVHNNAETLVQLHDRLVRALGDVDHEIVFVNDGSTDRSWQTIVALAAGDGRTRGLDLARNYGQHNALLAGIRAANQPIVVTLDADLQNPPEEIQRLLDKLDEGWDVVYGTPSRPQHGFWRNILTRLVRSSLRAAMGIDIANDVSGFRAFRTRLRDPFAVFQGPYVVIDVLLSWSTARFASVPVEHVTRVEGSSSYTFRRLAALALTMLIGFSTRPLRIASLLGFVTTLFGVALLCFVLVRYAVGGGSATGFPLLASGLAIFSGAQLLTLGVMGEYLARIHLRVLDRPPYSIHEQVGESAASEPHALL